MKIAVVEDDINMRKSLEIAISDYKGFEVKSFKNAKDALKNLNDEYDLIVTDINMPGMDGIEFIKTLNGKFEIIVITGKATLQLAIQAIKLGVKDFLQKPFEIETLIEAIKRNYKIRKLRDKNLKNLQESVEGFSLISDALKKPLEIAKKVALTDTSVILLGESGVGKEVFANFIHKNSNRNKKPFIAVNMAAIPDNLIESELFGFEKGAFTDAIEKKIGYFEEANEGTIFLDEIGEMPYKLQAKLLRVIQEKKIQRLGSSKNINLDIRIISATNVNLEEKINNKEFREDLFYRINTISIQIPPLRDRKKEILKISEDVLNKVCFKYNLGKKTFSKEAQDSLLSYAWPGNIRELISVVEGACILSEGEKINANDLFLKARESSKNINDLEKDLIQEVLVSYNFDKEKSCEVLSMSLSNLENKIKKYNIKVNSEKV